MEELIEDVVLEGGFGVNISIEKLRVQIGLSKLKLALDNLCMVNQIIAKSLGMIKDFKSIVRGIPHVMTFIVIQINVLDLL
jgi:hypothetical protein